MKRLNKWAAAIMLLPAIYLVSCGSGNNEKDRQDKISTQSPPPTQINPTTTDMAQSSSDSGSGLRRDEPDATGSAPMAMAGTKANTGTKSANNTLKSSAGTRKAATGKAIKRSTKTTEAGTHHHRSVPVKIDQKADTAARKLSETWDSTAKKIHEMADTATSRVDKLADTATSRVDRLADTAVQRLGRLGENSTIHMNHMMAEDSSSSSIMDSAKQAISHQQTDSSRNISTTDTGINFISSVFIPDQIRSNYAEIKMARMAIDKSQNDAVKQVATTLENDHNNLLRELQAMVKNPVGGADSIPTSENDMARQHMDMMKNLTGDEFDRQWLQHMHMMHDQKIQMFEQAESNNSIHDAELRIWVEKTLPTLKKHRDMLAQTLNAINK